MATKKRHFVTVIGEPKVGPEPHGIRYCMMCMMPITERDHWQKVRRGRGGIAVGVHDRCRVREVQE